MDTTDLLPEEQERIDAMKAHVGGEKPAKICKRFGHSRKWFYKWKKRFRDKKDWWYKDDSRKPKVIANKTKPEVEAAIITIRKGLMSGEKEGYEYSCVGVDAIQHKFSEVGYPDDRIPTASVIKRVIRESGLRVQKKKRYKRVHSKQRYKKIIPSKVNEFYCIDFKGPMYLKGSSQPIYGFCVKDVVGKEVVVDISTTKSMDFVISFFTDLFQKRDVPHYLQMDNERSFLGDFCHKRVISRFIKFLLHVGVEPIFIAQGKAWMNGTIEGFIRLFSENFWAKKQFKSRNDVRKEAKKFETNHNKLQQWKLKDKELKAIPSQRLDKNFYFDPVNIEITADKIHFIREVKNNGKVDVLNEEIEIGKGYVSERVWVTINVVERSLRVFHKAREAKRFKQIKRRGYEVMNL